MKYRVRIIADSKRKFVKIETLEAKCSGPANSCCMGYQGKVITKKYLEAGKKILDFIE